MIAYLRNHFRYYTMNSWNRTTSYAANVKLNHISDRFPNKESYDRAWDMLDNEEARRGIRRIMRLWEREQSFEYQVGFNGRSGGYMVMYRGEQRLSEYKSFCLDCGQKNYQSLSPGEEGTCGVCRGPRVNFDPPLMEVVTFPGKWIDEDADFETWRMYELRDRVNLVWSFDRMVEACIDEFVQFCATHRLEQTTEMRAVPVTKTVKI